jgi:hypothetical protein
VVSPPLVPLILPPPSPSLSPSPAPTPETIPQQVPKPIATTTPTYKTNKRQVRFKGTRHRSPIARPTAAPTSPKVIPPTKAPVRTPTQVRRSTCEARPSLKKHQALQHVAQTAINIDTGLVCEYHQLLASTDGPLWEASACEEWARLAQGLPSQGILEAQGTSTIKFIPITHLPTGRKATYPRIVVTDRPQKAQPRRVRVTVGGDQINYPHDVNTKTSGLTTVKLILNSTISTPRAVSCVLI